MRAGLLALSLVSACALAGCSVLPQSNPDADKDAAGAAPGGLFARLLRAPDTEADTGADGADPTSERAPTPLARVDLAGGDIVVAGPEGYCIDPETTQTRRGAGFAVIASCQLISQGRTGPSVPPAVVTVTAGPRGAATDLPSGAVLAEAANAVLLDSTQRDGLVTVHLASRGELPLGDGDTRYWRGAFSVNGRLVGLALYVPEGSALSGSRGERMLRQVTEQIRDLSPDG